MSVYHFTSADSFGAHASAVVRSAMRRIVAAVATPFAAAARRSRINRTYCQLQDLDDRTLADIGLRRTQVLSTATQVVDWPHVDPRRLAR